MTNARGYASPPCLMHEVDPAYMGLDGGPEDGEDGNERPHPGPDAPAGAGPAETMSSTAPELSGTNGCRSPARGPGPEG